MQLKELGKNVLLLLVTVIIFLLLFEIALRFALPQNLSRTQLDKDLLFSNRANLDGVRYSRFHEFQNYISTNSKGLRDSEHNYTKPENTTRILMLGDSFVEGVEVGFENTTSKVLEKELNSNPLRKFEVINAGVSGYGTSQELAYLEKEGILYHPDVVVLHFFSKNDLLDNVQKAVYSFNPENNTFTKVERKFSFFQQFWAFSIAHSHTTNLVANVLLHNQAIGGFLQRIDLLGNHQFEKRDQNLVSLNTTLSNTTQLNATPPNIIPVSYTRDIYYDNPRLEIQDSWKKTIIYFNQMQEFSKKYNFTLVIVFIPAKEQVDVDAYHQFLLQEKLNETQINILAPNAIMEQYALQMGIIYLDPTMQFREVDKQSKLYFINDGHYGDRGHALLAQLLYEKLIK